MFITNPEQLKAYDSQHRLWQGIPSAKVTESDILAGKLVTPTSSLQKIVSKLTTHA